jgi:N-acyl-D-aspartate/D-glutamate deacylase
MSMLMGVTTVVSGNCGFSAIPADPTTDAVAASGGILAGLTGEFTDLRGYFAAALERQPAINNLMLVGHNTVRAMTMGMEQRGPTSAELATMRGHVERAMEQGACGFSTGLIYRPGRWSGTEEVIELAKAGSRSTVLHDAHAQRRRPSARRGRESLRIGPERRAFTHFASQERRPTEWGKVKDSLARVDGRLPADNGDADVIYGRRRPHDQYFNLERSIARSRR